MINPITSKARQFLKKSFLIGLILAVAGLYLAPASGATAKVHSFQAEIWVDNWFSLYINGKKVGEDSVPISTLRSFNSQKVSFSASYPFTIGLVAKDYVENASGLEYISTAKQQIGDGGAIMQIRELASGKIVAATDSSWKTYVTNTAPTNPECVTSKNPLVDCKSLSATIPASWSTSTFKDSSWKSATEYTTDEVGVKEGYFDFTWAANARLVWSKDLKLENTVLIRKVVVAPTLTSINTKSLTLTSSAVKEGGALPMEYTCDGAGISPPLSWSGVPAGALSLVLIMDSIPGPPRPGETESGNHFYLTAFNIAPTSTGMSAGAKNVGTLGQNFQGKSLGYTPPCSQGAGTKIYTITLYAVSKRVSIAASDATLNSLVAAISGNILATSKLNVTYARP